MLVVSDTVELGRMGNMKWADAGDDDDFSSGNLPEPEVTGPDANGIKKVVEYIRHDDGKVVKQTRKIKVRKETRKVNKHVKERKETMPKQKFGLAKGAGAGPEKGITLIGEEVTLEIGIQTAGEQQTAEKDPLDKLQNKSIIVCRHCGKTGDHWTLKCPYKNLNLAKPEGAPQVGDGDSSMPGNLNSRLGRTEEPESGAGGSKYVPPSMRGDGARGGGESMNRRDENATVRVTNLSEDTKEADLQDLFRPFGAISRIYLAKDRNNNNISKGFAFINFVNRSDAQRAIDKLSGYGYDHLILHVEWANKQQD